MRYLLSIFLLLAAGCEIVSPDARPVVEIGPAACDDCRTELLEIHLNNSFDDDRVRILMDERPVFDDRVTTDYVWSLARIVELQPVAGMHDITVLVNGYKATRTVDLDRPLYVQVQYYPEPIRGVGITDGIVIHVLDERPLYD